MDSIIGNLPYYQDLLLAFPGKVNDSLVSRGDQLYVAARDRCLTTPIFSDNFDCNNKLLVSIACIAPPLILLAAGFALKGGHSPSFKDFILAAQRVNPKDALVLNGGQIERKRPFLENEKNLNNKTWRAFDKAVRREFTPTRIRAISARYGFDYEQMVRSELDVERRYVEYFGVGAASPYTFNLKESQSWWSSPLKKCSPAEIHRLYQDATSCSFLGKVEDPTQIDGGVRHAHEQLTNVCLHTDQTRSNLFRGVSNLTSKDPNIPRMHPYYQRLEMGITCHLETDPKKATLEVVIPAPGITDGDLDYYKVHKIISKGGLSAIALVPISNQSHLDPILAFRCTKQTLGHTGVFSSNLNNLEEHIGWSGYKECKEELDELCKDLEFSGGKKINVLSFSQGGAHAAYFMRDHWKKVKDFISFNSVGSDARVVNDLADGINKSDQHTIPPNFYMHRNVTNKEGTEGDWVNKSGQLHIGHGIKHPNARVSVYEWLIRDYTSPTNNIWDPAQVTRWLNLHGVRSMDLVKENEYRKKWKNGWIYSYKLHRGPTQADKILDTYNRDPTLEDLRRNIGYGIVYNIATTMYSTIDFILRLFDIKFFKRNLR